jgi:hypothetical protein
MTAWILMVALCAGMLLFSVEAGVLIIHGHVVSALIMVCVAAIVGVFGWSQFGPDGEWWRS